MIASLIGGGRAAALALGFDRTAQPVLLFALLAFGFRLRRFGFFGALFLGAGHGMDAVTSVDNALIRERNYGRMKRAGTRGKAKIESAKLFQSARARGSVFINFSGPLAVRGFCFPIPRGSA